MPKFRKRPVEIEAILFVGFDIETGRPVFDVAGDIPAWLAGSSQDRAGSRSLFIKTLEGVMEASPGDMIIRGVKDEVYPCKPDIFAATYDPA